MTPSRAPLCFALNGNLLDRLRRGGLDPMQLVLGSALLALPVALILAGFALVRPRAARD